MGGGDGAGGVGVGGDVAVEFVAFGGAGVEGCAVFVVVIGGGGGGFVEGVMGVVGVVV